MPNFEKSYLDTEQELFGKLPEEERVRRISESGEDGAVQQYGYEMALRSMDKKEGLVTPEEKESEIYKKLEQAAQNAIKCFGIKYDTEGKRGQNLVLITDEGVPPIVRQAFIEQAGLVVGNKDLRVIVSQKPNQLAELFGEAVGNKILFADKVILLTSKSRSHSKESKNALVGLSKYQEVIALQQRRQKEKGSMFSGKTAILSIPRANNLELLTNGAALENVEKMWERTEKFMEKFRGARKAFITTEQGTNLEIKIKSGTIAAETGKLDQPGNIANFPFGEVTSAPSWEETSGVLVVDGVGGKAGATTNEGYIKEPIKLYIENGEVKRIEGGKEATEFWQYLEEVQQNYLRNNLDGKGSAFKLAEFSVGMNSAAWRDKDGIKILPPTQLEAEKALGTIHIAVGNNALLLGLGGFGKEDPEYNDINFHSDQVILKPSIVIENENGERVEIMRLGELQI